MKRSILIPTVVAAALGLAGQSAVAAPPAPAAPALPGMQTGAAPWPPQISLLLERLQAMGLPALRREGTELHLHQHLDLFINGKAVAIPPQIGINMVAGFIAQVHTHDGSGVIHIESPVVSRFTLGQFFDIWGVRFTPSCLGSYCKAGDTKLRVYVNGKAVTTNPRDVELADDQAIVVTYGTAKELPNPIPSTFKSPS
jgi:hypothetical protein